MTQKLYFNFGLFGHTIKSFLKYGDTLRPIAKEIGISTATLSRAINGKAVDINTAINICAWMEWDFNDFVKETSLKS